MNQQPNYTAMLIEGTRKLNKKIDRLEETARKINDPKGMKITRSELIFLVLPILESLEGVREINDNCHELTLRSYSGTRYRIAVNDPTEFDYLSRPKISLTKRLTNYLRNRPCP
tara:strand:- start:28 stop:369 length:342 start_codon:yes stop_codon:yes gene_type:complete